MNWAPLILLVLVGDPGSWHDRWLRDQCERDPSGCVVVCTQATPIEEGDPAPCGGVLIPDDWALQLVELRDVALPKCEADAERGAKVAAASLERCDQERRALAEALRDTDQMLEAVGPPAPPQWYESPGLWFSVGLVVGAVTVGAASR
tara:strand:- start:878 stop:1321 length:444 start_codon:yes stop_codon:yes gene_type:complete